MMARHRLAFAEPGRKVLPTLDALNQSNPQVSGFERTKGERSDEPVGSQHPVRHELQWP